MLSLKQTHSPTLTHTHTSTHRPLSPTSSRPTNKRPLLADFISFRGYRTDWVSTTLAVWAYRSKAATRRISRAADAIKKTGKKKKHFSGTQWRNNLVCHLESRNVCCTMRGSPESQCWRQHLNGQTLGPQPAPSMPAFITHRFSRHKSVSTPVLHRRATEAHKEEIMLAALGG